MSGIEVVGLISAVIAIVGTIENIYNGLRDAKNLPRAFREVAEKLPLVRNTLQIAERHISANTDEEACQAIKNVLEKCKVKAEHLEEIFNAVAPEHPSRLERYRVVVRRLGKGNLVEVLTKEMMEDVRLLAVNRAIQAATESQIAELLKAIEELSSLEPSLLDEDSISQHHYGSGDNVWGDKIGGNQNIANGSGPAYFGAVTQQYDKSKVKECIRDLFLTDPYTDMQALKRKKGGRAKGTCDWILETHELTVWLGDAVELTSPPTDVLWLYGNPGTGKSTMSMFLAEALPEVFPKTPKKTLAYFFCDSGYDTRKTAAAVVRGLLLQLVQQHPRLIEHVLPKYEERNAQAFNSFDAVWAIFLKACADKATGRKYCLIDALDECEQDEQEMLLKQIEDTFGQARSGAGTLNVSLLITSRPYLEIRECLQNFPKKDLASFEESRQDIHKFVDEKVAKLSRKKSYPNSVARSVTRILRERAGGIFLWVGLVCQELEKVASRNAVTRLQQIPAGLQSLYRQLLDTALQQDDKPDTVKRLLGFVMVARRPFTIRELASACQLYQDEDDEERIQFTTEVIAACRLMIVVQDEKVLLLHQSVRDFLVGDAGSSWRFISELEAHNGLARRCIDYLIANYSPQRGGHATGDNFVSYSIRFWPDHAHMAKEEFQIEASQAEFFTINSRQRDTWWKGFVSEKLFEPSWVSVFHIAARWGIPLLVDHALSSEHRTSRDTAPFSLYVDAAYEDSEGRTPLMECATSGHIQVLKLMLERADLKSHMAGAVIRRAASNEESGVEVMKVLLDWRGDQVTITEDIVKAAAGNRWKGVEVVELLLDRKGDQITITEDIVEAAAGNWQSGVKVMKVLLDWRGDQVTITEDIVKAAAGNRWKGVEVVELLLDRKGDQITITEDIVEAAAGNRQSGAKVMELLLDRRGDQVTITEDIIKAAAGNWQSGAEVMEVLLDRREDQITITEDVVKAAAGNEEGGSQVMELLLDRKGDQVTITEDIVKAAAGNGRSRAEVMEILLDRRGDQVTITEDIVKAAAGNEEGGSQVMKLLLDWKGDQVTITERAIAAVAGNFRAKVIELLLDRRGDQVTITEDTVKAAARNEECGFQVMQLLLARKGDQLTHDGIRITTSSVNGQLSIVDSNSMTEYR
ncbi:hypothetical protein ACHAQF_008397 [Verticillium nonalfalfae]